MGAIPVTDPHKAWNVKQFKRLEAYNARLQKLLDNAIKNAAAIAMLHDAKASDEHLFSFSDDRQMKAEADKLMKDLSDEITSFTQSAIGKEWEKALQQATEYIGQIYNLAEQTQNRQDYFLDMMLGMRSRNEDALIEFNKRKIGDLNLSKKVWSYTQDFERQLEVSIDTALMQGMSANNLALSIQSLLKNPDDLFRRVRDENDQLRMSKAMAAYHPGTGKYRSAYKNAMRLARSEINMAYRSSDCNVAMMSDCCVGIEIHLSNNHNCKGVPKGEFYDICDQLAGKYPKDFQWTGWHPQCRCFMTYVLKTDDEFWTDLENGENNESVNTVKDVPDNFKEWVKDNEERIKTSEQKGTTPYFLKDNKKYFEDGAKNKMSLKGVSFSGIEQLSDLERKELIRNVSEISRKGGLFDGQINVGFAEYNSDGTIMTWKDGGVVIDLATYRLSDGTIFSGSRELLSATRKLEGGLPLTFKEEYTIECLYHESVHAKAKNLWRIEKGSIDEVIMETCTQLYAREKYTTILKHYGYDILKSHQDMIRTDGFGYRRNCNQLRQYFQKDGEMQVGELINIANGTESGERIIRNKMKKHGFTDGEIMNFLKSLILY